MIGAEFASVLASAQGGDESAFARLWLDVNPALVRYLRVVLGEVDEDVAAEAWVTVVRGLARFRGNEMAWRGWVFTTARRRAVDEGRGCTLVERRDQAGALVAFRETFAMPHPSQPRRRRPAMLSSLLRAKLAVALAAGAVGFGGLAAAAYAGALPDRLPDLAHTTVGAPVADPDEAEDMDEAADSTEITDPGETAEENSADSTKDAAVGPDATGPAAFGLCTAWEHVQASPGRAAEKSVAFHNLATAAGGVNGITAYCATIPHPGADVADKPKTHPVKPSKVAKPSSHSIGKPSIHPAGKPEGGL